ncbi:hypothetical protein SDC9_198507 [bioreactor metagenome]|uniref:Uncharacterized protein n=1 Tax=bioreactor metagenome TaxID=1076179 RepID=A0A645IHU4_9ZZZZ
MVAQRSNLERIIAFQILEQLLLLLGGVFLPPLGRLCPLHHARGLRADESTVECVLANLAALHAVAPFGGAPRGLAQVVHLAREALVFGELEIILPAAVFLPAGEVALLHLDARAVDRENMIHAAVEKRAVVGHENESLLAA